MLYFYRLKGRSAVQHCVKNDTDRPEVNLIAVAICVLENFGCQIVRGTTDSFLALTLVKDLGCKAKITDFKLHALCKEQIAKFEISVDDPLAVDILYSLHQLVDIVASLNFMKALSSAHQIGQRLVMADVQ